MSEPKEKKEKAEPVNMDGIVDIKGKLYKTVARRIQDFRDNHPDYSVITRIDSAGSEHVLVRCRIKDEKGRVIATGHAEESRDSSYINKTSAIENAETSAIGRALAALGYGGEFYASANEVEQAEWKQELIKAEMRGINYGMACYKHKDVIENMKDRLADGDLLAAAESYMSLTNNEQTSIKKAPTKGGIFTVEEVKQLNSAEFKEACIEGIKANPNVDRSI